MTDTQPYVRLCLKLEEHNVQLELHAAPALKKTTRGDSFRDLEALIIRLGPTIALREKLRDTTLDVAAERLLARLVEDPEVLVTKRKPASQLKSPRYNREQITEALQLAAYYRASDEGRRDHGGTRRDVKAERSSRGDQAPGHSRAVPDPHR